MSDHQADTAVKHTVRVHIDRVAHRSPDPTDGDAIYALGNVKHGHALYQEVHGDEEDRLVHRGKEKIHVAEDEHFYSAEPVRKVFTVFVNGRAKEVAKKTLSFAEVVTLAAIPGDANTIYTVTYKKGRRDAEGSMVAGDPVTVKEGMIFNVTATSKS